MSTIIISSQVCSFVMVVSQKPSKEDYKRQLDEYRKVIDEWKKKQISQVLKWDDSEKQVQKAFEGLIENPKIYSWFWKHESILYWMVNFINLSI